MCGFLFTNTKQKQAVNALYLMRFRGPDSSYYEVHGDFFLGHNRLAILDLSNAGIQPMYSHSKKNVILYNGEIYNFRELATEYSIHLQSNCDTELLLELYEKIGLRMVDKLNGMFSFIILNCETNDFVVVRDRLGVKPLYYSIINGYWIFSSEIAPIKFLIKNTTIDEIGLRQYKKLRAFFRGHTIWNEIKMFPAGSYFSSSKRKFDYYWEFQDDDKDAPSDDELFDLLKTAVNYRMISDVSVGCFLSGGLDSSIIASLMQQVETWSVGSIENNEFKWSQQIADNLGMPHNKIIVEAHQYKKILKKMVRIRQEPISVPNEIMIYLMSQEAKRKNTVVLGGEGADELFFGYDRIFSWANSSQWNLNDFDFYYSYSKGEDMEILEYVLEPYIVKSNTALKTVARFFQIAHLHGLLRRLDFSTMLASVEARVPFVDHRLVDRMAGVSFEYRMKDGVIKAPLKRIFSSLLPVEILKRNKIGFPVDIEKMLSIPNAEYKHFFNLNLSILFGEEKWL